MAVLCLSRSRSACCSGRCDLAASGSSGDFAPSEFTATGTNQRDITASAQEDRADGGMMRMRCSMLCISTERAWAGEISRAPSIFATLGLRLAHNQRSDAVARWRAPAPRCGPPARGGICLPRGRRAAGGFFAFGSQEATARGSTEAQRPAWHSRECAQAMGRRRGGARRAPPRTLRAHTTAEHARRGRACWRVRDQQAPAWCSWLATIPDMII